MKHPSLDWIFTVSISGINRLQKAEPMHKLWSICRDLLSHLPSLDLDEGSFLTLVFSKVVIFCYLWKAFKGKSRNICFIFEVQRSLQTKTLKLQRILQKKCWHLCWHITATFEKTKVKTIIFLGLVDPIAERFYTLYIASSSHDLCMNCSWG